ncbi:hypothetical protein [Paenibacillus sp.]|uniref:hypothetical protein n=1 Tax=Paenibacillus sp. TaxID=58172 RepID=UPI002810AE5B|nr:hypothetical protein [Paenibacillus sp.]
MSLNRYDMAVIEQALREAINQGADYHKISTYQTVLGKLQGAYEAGSASRTTMAQDDGFRYDYDDSADMQA